MGEKERNRQRERKKERKREIDRGRERDREGERRRETNRERNRQREREREITFSSDPRWSSRTQTSFVSSSTKTPSANRIFLSLSLVTAITSPVLRSFLYKRCEENSENTRNFLPNTYSPPPYSCTRVRTFISGGDRSVNVPSSLS